MRILLSFLLIVGALAFSQAHAEDIPLVPSWTIIPEESAIDFEGTQMGAPFKGSFKSFEGSILFDPSRLQESSAKIVIDMGSVDAGSDDRNIYIRMQDWLDITRFPQAHFITTGFEKGLGPDQYVASGQLTVRDVTLPVTLPFTLTVAKGDNGAETASMAGETIVNRLDFGVGQGGWKDTKSVGAEIKIRVNMKAVRGI